MSHEITETDNVTLAVKPAWHGLGIVTAEAKSPMEAMRIAGADWKVIESYDPEITHEGITYKSENTKALLREDTKTILKYHSSSYSVLQNHQLFEIADSIPDVKIESAGTLGGGRKVFCTLRIGEMYASEYDKIESYICLLNTHDGSTGLAAFPTSIRPVCANTLSMAFSKSKSTRYSFRHTGDMDAKVEEFKKFMGEIHKYQGVWASAVESMQGKRINNKELVEFYNEIYNKHFLAPSNKDQNTKKVQIVESWVDTLIAESMELSQEPNYWLATNAITKNIQSKSPKRVAGWEDKDKYSKFFGKKLEDSNKVFNHAFQLMGA